MVNNVHNPGISADLIASLNGKATSASNKDVAAAAATQDRFLKLLVTQMKNQDPLNPMDNAQVTSQMAQLSTVTGVDRLNATLQAMSDSMRATQNLQAATMIGHGVLVPGNGLELANGKAYGGVELNQSVDRLSINVLDGAGNLLRRIELGTQSAGMVNWQWDGRADNGNPVPDGYYSFKVEAMQAGNKVEATALQFGVVNGVTQSARGATLSVGRMEGVALAEVRQILR